MAVAHCACAPAVVHLPSPDIAEDRAATRAEATALIRSPFPRDTARGAGTVALVFAPGICHVPHRTVLLSQFLAHACVPWPLRERMRKKREQQVRGPAAGARARRTAAK